MRSGNHYLQLRNTGKNVKGSGLKRALFLLGILLFSLPAFSATWHSFGTGNADNLSNWFSASGGSGSNPASFASAGDTWIMETSMTTSSSTWNLAGTLQIGGSVTFTPADTIYAGNLQLSGSAQFFPNGLVTVYLSGNLSVAGTSTFNNAAVPGETFIHFNNTSSTVSSPQTVTWSSTGVSQYADITVNSGCVLQLSSNLPLPEYATDGTISPGLSTGMTVNGTLVCGTNVISDPAGSDVLTVNSGASFYTANSGGINSSASVSTYTLSGGANYVFNGSATQVTGTLMPATITSGGSVTVNNSAGSTGVTLSQATTVNSGASVNLENGVFTISAGLTMNSSSNVVRDNGTISATPGTYSSINVTYANLGNNASAVTVDNEFPSSLTGTVTVNKTGATITLNGAKTLNGTIILTAGTLDASASNYNISLTRNWTNNSGTSAFTARSASVTFSGSVVQNINGSFGTTFNNLTLNNSAGATLGADETVTNTLTLTSGNITIGAHNLILGASAAAVSGSFSSSAMIVANSTGQVRKDYSSNGSYLFPIGDNSSNYTPITLSVSASAYSSAYVGVNVTNAKDPHNANTANYLNRYWSVATSGITSPSYSVTNATYVPGDVSGTESAISAGQYPGSLPWVKFGSVNTSTHSFSTSAVTSTTSEFSGITTAGPSVSSSANVTICVGGSAGLTASSGTGDPTLTYAWTPATGLSVTTGTSVTATPTVTTIYTVTITDGNGFTGFASTQVSVNATPTAAPTNSGPICNSGTVTLTANPGGSTSVYAWSGANLSSATAQNPTATPTVTTTYSLTVTNGSGNSGCSSGYTTTVSVNATPTAAPTNSGPICNTGTVNLTANQGGSTSVYNWSGPNLSSSSIANPTATPTATATYSLTVTNGTSASGCSSSYTTTVSVNATPTAAPTNSGPICIGGTANLGVNPGGSTTVYTWSGANLSATTILNPTATPTVTSVYSLTVTNGTAASGCTTNYTTTVSVNATPVAAPAPASTICVGGTVVLLANPGGSTNTYSWSGPNIANSTVQNPTATPTVTSTYSLTVTNGTSGSGCSSSYTTVATVNATPVAAPTNSGPICNGGTVNLTSNPAGSTTVYAWSGSNLSSPSAQNPTATPTVTTTYSLTVTNGSGSSGCSSSYTTLVLVNATPTAAPTNSGPICNGGTVTLTANPAGTTSVYAWSGANLSSATAQNPTATPTATSVYSLTVTNGTAASGCSTSYTTTVSVNATPTAAPTNSSPICNGGTVNLTANPGGSTTVYTWSGANLSSATAQNPTATPTVTTTYSLTVTNGTSASGCSTSYTTIVTVNTTPTAAPTNSGPICIGGTVTLFANPAGGTNTYNWSGSNLATTTDQNPVATPTVTSTYSLTVSSSGAAGCSPSTVYTTTVIVNPIPVASPTNSGPICIGGTVTLNANPAGGATIYAWTGANLASTTAQNPTATPSVTTTYSLTVSSGSASGCTPGTVYTTTVSVNPIPTAAPTNDGPICNGGTVNLFANPIGTTTNYLWSGPNLAATTLATTSATPTVTSTYSLTVTDGTGESGCNSSYTTTVTINPNPTASPTNSGPICSGGTVTLTANPGTGVITYNWSGSNLSSTTLQNPTATPTATSVYSLTVSSGGASGCGSSSAFTTTVSVNPIPFGTPTNSGTICAGGTLTLNANPSGGTNAYLWSGMNLSSTTAQNPTATPTVTTTYSLTVSSGSASGCSPSTIFTTTASVNPTPTAAPVNSGPICIGGTVFLNSFGSATVTTYAWSGPALSSAVIANPTATPTVTSTYSLTVTDGSGDPGCSSSYTTLVSVNPTPTAAPTNSGYICAGGTVTLTANPSGGASVYSWSGSDLSSSSAQNPTATPTVTTTYSLTVSSSAASGCSPSTVYTTTVSVNPTPVAAPTNNGPICVGATVTLTSNPSGGVTTYSWSGPNLSSSIVGIPTATPTVTSTYSLTVSSSSAPGCNPSTIYTTLVSVNPTPTASPVNNGPICNGGTVSLLAVPSATATVYAWSGSNLSSSTIANPTATPTVSSTYSLTVSDGSGDAGCSSSYTTNVSVNPTPAAAPTNSGTICSGGTVTLNANPSGGASIYSWSGSDLSSATAQNPTATPTVTTTYSLTVSSGGASGCSPSTVYTTTVSVNPTPTAAPTNSGTICNGSTVSLTANPSGGVTAYSWSGANLSSTTIANPTATPTVTTTYSLTVSSSALPGCSPSTIYTTTVSVNPLSPITGPTEVCKFSDILLNDATTGGAWSTSNARASVNSSSGDVTGVATGAVTISYVLSTGCTATYPITVNAAVASITGTAVVCQGLTTTLSETASGGTWSSSATGVATVFGTTFSATVTGVSGGNATITYTIGTGCYATDIVTVNPSPAAIGGNLAVCQGLTTSLTETSSGGTWTSASTGVATIGSTGSPVTVNGVSPGTSVITYTLPTSCLITATVTVNSLPTAVSVSGTGTFCGITTITASGGTGGTIYYEGTVSGGTSTATPATSVNVTTTGTYYFNAQSAAGCWGTQGSVSVTINPVPTASPTNSGPICNGGTATLTANGSATASVYSWSGPAGFSSSLTNPTVTPTVTSTYSLTVSDGSGNPGCSPSTIYTTTVTVNPNPTAAPTNSGPICIGGTVTLTANPSASVTAYTWSGSNLSSSSVQNPTATPTVTTTYSLTVSSGGASGCSPSTVYTTTVSVNPTPTAAPTSSSPICNGGTVNLTANPSATVSVYLWSGANLATATIANTTATPTVTSTYSLTVTDGSGFSGCSSSYTTSVSVNPTPTAAPTNSGTICIGGTVSLTANPSGGASIYSWSGSNLSSTAAQNPTATPTVTTTYSLTVSSGGASGCSPATVYTTTVSVNPTPTAAPTNSGPICIGGTVNLAANPGGTTATYAWSGANLSSATIQNPSATPTVTTTYSLTVSDGTSGSGCVLSYTTLVSVNPTPTAAPTNSGPICNGGTVNLTANPSATVSVYLWSGANIATATIANTTATPTVTGTYSLTVTDGSGFSGCSSSYTTSVSVNPTPTAAPTNNSPICISGTVNLFANPSGGVATYTWSGSNLSSTTAQNPTATPTVTTTYSLTVSSGGASGCSPSTVYTTTVSVNPTSVAAPTNDGPICVGGTVNLTANPSGGVTNYTWVGANLSSTTVQNPTATPTVTSTYSLTVSAPGCTPSIVYTTVVTVNPIPTAAPTNSGPVCNGGTVTLTANGANGASIYTWSGSNLSSNTAANPTATPTVTTTYSLTVSSGAASGCSPSTVYTTTVSVNPTPTAAPTNSGPICNGGTVTLTANPANGATAYAWSGPGLSSATTQNPTATPTVTTTYSLTVSSGAASGCSPSTVYVTTVSVNATPTAAPVNSGPICNGGTVNLNAFGGGSTSAYAWSGPNLSSAVVANPTATPTVTTTYSLTVTNGTSESGCSSSYTTTVSVNPTPTAAPTNSGPICNGGTVTLTANPANGASIYSWSGSNLSSSTAQNPTATPTVTTTYSLTVSSGGASGCSPSTVYTTTVSVNPTPTAAPTNSGAICFGNTATLSANPSGGVTAYAWSGPDLSSSTVANPTVTPTVTSTYSLTVSSGAASGCSPATVYTTTVSVNPLPAPISGLPSLCVALTTTLSDATGTGTWSSSNTSVATIGSTGVVNGVALGTATITYTIPSSCFVTQTVTVYPTPVAVVSPSNVCVGSTITASDATGGGSWSSSSTGTATIGSASGVVTGVAPGTVTISYSLGLGCNATALVTVNPLPVAISGTAVVCPGLTTTLTDTSGASSGIWTSDNTGVATVGSSTGVVTGVSAGTTFITYTLPTGCFATTTFTVDPAPASITGNLGVCSGATSTLSDASGSGTWTSGSTGVATIGSSSGIVSTVSTGTSIITYTLPTGCINTATVTVNPLPATIGGTTNVCTGSTTTLTETSGTSTWSSSDITLATVGSGTGIVTGVAAGTPVITFTLPTGCIATQVVTVNPTPAAITGTPVVCIGATTTLSDVTGSGIWTSSNGRATVGSATGVVTGVASGAVVISYTLSTGCFAIAPATINPNPVGISGTMNVCVGSTSSLSDASGSGAWSSSNATIASIGSTGIVTGVSAGTVNITYQLATGCLTASSFTVNAVPSGITGTATVCTGVTTTLADAITGGTWSSSNTSFATVGSTSGIVTGVASGNPSIIYTLPGGCNTAVTLTVNSSPAAIGGTPAVCVGLTTTLTDGSTPGVWTSSNPSLATVGSSSGTVTGVSSGSPTITYTISDGCTATQLVSVNPIPAAISGTTVVCSGSTITLTDITGGGTWSSSNTSLATVGSTSGIVTGVSSGTPTITYTMPAGCTATVPVTVNAVPDIGTFSPPSATSQCVGLPATVTVSSSSLGAGSFTVTYNLSGANSATSNSATLTMGSSTGTFTTSALTNSGTTLITITSVINSFGCSSNLPATDTVSVTTYPSPTAYTVSGGGGYCSGGSGSNILLSLSDIGINYQVYLGSTPMGSPVSGTSATLNLGPQTTAGTYTVLAINATTTCTTNMIGSATVSVDPLPTAYSVTGGGSYCSGGSGVAIGVANSNSGFTYQLYNGVTPVGSPVSGTGSPISFGLQTVAGGYTVVATNAATTCTNTMSGSASITINSLPSAITGVTNACVSGTTTLSDTSSGGTWTSNNTSVATVGSSSGVVTGVGSGATTITYTLATGCTTNTGVTVNPLPASISGTPVVCTGLTSTLSDGTGGGSWSSSNTALATVGSSTGVVTGVTASNPVISYTLPTGCSSTVTITVNTTPGTISGGSNVCTGFTIGLSDGLSGGTWSSSNPSLATIGSSTGVVTGIASGTPAITYTVTGCSITALITVNPTPAAISGTAAVCIGLTTSLADATSGGVWSSGNTAQATVGSTGVVTGVAAGIPNISYTVGTGCYALVPVTVSAVPSGIAGVGSICTGLTTTLIDATSGGLWSSSNTAVATVGSSSGVVTGVSSGGVVITYTVTGGCIATFAMSVNTVPAAISGVTNVCPGLTTTMSDGTIGGAWSSSNTSLATVNSSSGLVTGIATGVPVITYTLPATGCIATQAVTVNPLPSVITGTTVVCAGSTIALSDSAAGGTWSSSNTAQATVNGSTGIVTGVASGNPVITYTLSTGCLRTVPVTVNPDPAAITGVTTLCTGTTTTMTDATGSGVWSSSNTTYATVGSTSGIVTGLTAGVVNISYTLAAGCSATLQLSVNQQPSVITGNSSVCTGATTTLSDTLTGGTWTSSNTTDATIGASSGIVSGSVAGSITISYTLPGGCTATLPFTVNTTPAAISGANNVCVAANTTLTDASSGGTWSSSNTTIATVGSSSGVVTGIATGPATITYTLPGGCIATTLLTVNPLPASITGFSVVCVNATSTLSDGTSGGLWSSSSTGVATIGSTSGTITGISTGAPTFSYSLTATGCFVTIPGTVNPLPTAYSVTGGGAYCAGGSGIDVGLGGSNTGINYQLYDGVTAVGGGLSGTGAALDFGLQTAAGTYTIVANNTTTGCTVTMTGSAIVNMNPVPTSFTVTSAGTSYCAGGSGITIGLTGSSANVRYQLYDGTATSGSLVPGTGSAISFGAKTAAGVYTVVATDTLYGCTSTMTGIASITINPLPFIDTVTGGGAYCTGGTGVHVGLSNSSLAIKYQLFNSGAGGTILAGTGSAIDYGLITAGGIYTIVATDTATGCTSNMSGSVTVTINPLPTATETVTGTGSYCAGGTGLAIGLSPSQSGVNYQLYYSGSPVGAAVSGSSTGAAISFGSQTAGGTYTVIGTFATTTCSVNITTSATITINPLPNPAYSVTGGGGYCSGTTAPVIGLSNGDAGITYKLLLGATLEATTAGSGVAFNFAGTFGTAGTYTVTGTSAAGCVSTMTGSAVVAVNALPTQYPVTGTGSYCAGGVGLAIGLANSVTGINYQLYLGGSPISSVVAGTGTGTSTSPITFGLEVAAGTYSVVATNATTLCTSTTTSNAVITINTLPLVMPVTGGGSYCAGGIGDSIGLSSSTSGISYKLYNGAAPTTDSVTGGGAAISFGRITASGSYDVIATNPATGCTNTMGGTAIITINTPPALNNVLGGGSYCAGGTGVSIGLNGSVTGNSYQLYNGASPSGTALPGTGFALNFGLQTTAGTYTIVATNATGCTSTMTGTAVVSVNPLPVIDTVTGGGSYCAGGAGIHIGLNTTSAGVSYQLYIAGGVLGLPVTGAGTALDFGLQTLAGTYTVVATNGLTTCSSNMFGSPAITINSLPSLYTVSGGGSYCSGGGGRDITLSGSDAGVNYQLYLGTSPVGSPMAGTGSGLDFGLHSGAGIYTVVATNATSACTSNMVGSATVIISPLPTVYPMSTAGGAYCAGGTGIDIALSNSNTGINYQLYNGTLTVGAPMPGTTGTAVDFGLQTVAGIYMVVATNAVSGCTSNMSGTSTITINTLPVAYTVTGGGGYCAGSSGVYVGLSGSNTGVNYQLYNGLATVGTPVPGTDSILDFGLQTAAGVYTVVAINSGTACTANMTSSATITINPLPNLYAVTGGGSYCSGGAGLHVGLSASDMGINYQLFKGTSMLGTAVAGTGFPLDFGIQMAAGIYSVVATDAVSGCTQNMSGPVSIMVNSLPAVFTVTGGGNYCAGGTGFHVGVGGSVFGVNYQLYNGTTAVGSAMAGTGSSLDFGLYAVPGTYTVVATNSATSCSSNMTGSAIITVNPLPVVYTISGGGGYCPGGTGVHVGLSGSDTGVNYHLYRGGSSVASVPGSDSTIDFGLETVSGAYSVVAVNASSGCTSNMTGTVVVTVNTLPSVYSVTGGGSYCAGGIGLHVGVSNSASGVNYQLYKAGLPIGVALPGTGLPLDLGVESFIDTYTVVAVNAATGCSANMSGYAVVAINPLPALDTLTGGGSYCAGGSGLHIELNNSTSGIHYQLFRGTTTVGTPLAGTGSVLDFGLLSTVGTYKVVATNPATGCTNNMVGSISIVVNALPAVYSVIGGGSYCVGGSGVLVKLTASDTGISYQLYQGTTLMGTPVAGTGGLLNFGLQTTTGVYTVVATNTTSACTQNMAGSATISTNPLPVAYTVTGGGSYCAGGAGEHVSLSGSDAGITYQLYKTGVPSGSAVTGTGALIDFGAFTAAGVYTVGASNTATGCTSNMTGSASITVNPLPVVYSVTGGGNYCAGGSGVPVGLYSSDTGVNYQLYNASTALGTAVHGTDTAISFGLQTLSGSYTVVATNASTGCISDMSGFASITITPTVMPSVTISSGGMDTVCAGTLVSYSVTTVNGGSAPAYLWKLNDSVVSAGSAYSYYPANGDAVTVTMTSNAACALPDSAVDTVIMTVNANVTPTIAISVAPRDTVCAGTLVTFSAVITNGGAAPAFTWKVGSATVSSASSFSYMPTDGDVVYCQLNSSYGCVTTPVAVSNDIHMNVQAPALTPTVAITFNSGIYSGGVVYNDTFTAVVTNGGIDPAYQWSVNGVAVVGATSSTFIENNLNVDDAVSCYVVNNNPCGTMSATGTFIIPGLNNVGVKPVVTNVSDIQLIPNPNKGIFTIKGSLGITTDEEVYLEITDMLGQVIYKDKVIARNGDLNEKIQLTNTPANGMYILSLHSGNENKIFHVIIEQ